jgi:threonine dehydratase
VQPIEPKPTTLVTPERLNDHIGIDITLAVETFQVAGSFKFRAAWNVAKSVPHPHLIAASSGNFGQALACAAKMTGKRCTIVMPQNSAQVKIDAILSYDGIVDLVNTHEISRAERVKQLAAEFPDAYITSAFDDLLVIEGNSSLGVELAPHGFDVVIAPVGGGGLTAGLINGLRRSGSTTSVVGAEPLLANDAAESLRQGKIVGFEVEQPTIADGARTLALGTNNWAVLEHGLDGIIEVDDDTIRDGVRLLYSHANLKVEPTGALALGAVLTQPTRFAGKKICCVVSGGNVDPAVYAGIISSQAN